MLNILSTGAVHDLKKDSIILNTLQKYFNTNLNMFASVLLLLARNEEFSKIAVINIIFTVLKKKTQLSVGGGGSAGKFS